VLGDIERDLGRFEPARMIYADAATLYRSLEHAPGRASVALKTGDLELWSGRIPEADQAFREALALYAGAQDDLGRAYVLARLGDLDLRRGRAALARQALRDALALVQTFPSPPLEFAASSDAGALTRTR
jgi:tetratricopeptide (TPR) repeat protein